MANISAGGMAALSAFDSVLGAWTLYQQGKAQKYQYRANERIAEVNSRIAEMQARDALKRGHETEARSRQGTKKLRGSQRASIAAQGIRTDFGSAQDIQQETEDIGELDALTIRNNAAREAFDYRSQGGDFTMQALEAGTRGRMASSTGAFGATQTLLTGGIRALGYYKEWQDNKVKQV